MKNLLILLCLLSTTLVFGQDRDSMIERKGFVFGFGVGAGVVSIADSGDEAPFDEVQAGISLPNFKLGWMVSDRLALLATFPGMIYEHQGKDRSFEAFIPTAQYWVDDRWWINGGVGLAMDFPAFYDIDDFSNEEWNFGGAVSISTGIELVQKGKYALDLQTRVHMGRVFLDNDEHRDGVAFTISLGFNWY